MSSGWLKSALPAIPKPEVLVAISQRRNPGDSAVACVADGETHARHVGEMSNCRAAWFAAELALDVTNGPIAIVTCLTELSAARISDAKIIKNERLYDRDIDILARVKEKWRESEFIFRRKIEDSRFETLREKANSHLSAPLWTTSDNAAERFVDRLAEESTESPLESVLLREMKRHFPERKFVPCDPKKPWVVTAAFGGPLGMLIPQLVVGPHRGDFAIIGDTVSLFVEVDGYRFHDFTRDQLERDRKRDRYLMRAGWRVIRFTGREVNANPSACANEVVATLRGLE